MAIPSLDQENPPYTPTVREFAGGISISVLWMRDLADAYEMGLGGSLVVAVAASSLPGLRSGLRWWITGDRRSIALRSD